MLYAVDAAMLFLAWRRSNNCVLSVKRSNRICDSTAQPPCCLLRVCQVELQDCDLQEAKVLDCLGLSKTWTHCQDAYEASIHLDAFFCLLVSYRTLAALVGGGPPGVCPLCVSIRVPVLLFELHASNPSAAHKTRSSELTLDEHSSI